MSYSSKLTKERIMVCAKKEFLEKGFKDANIRDIANCAKATTGAVYNHFKNKEGLFEAIVGDVANKLLELFNFAHGQVPNELKFSEEQKRESMANGSFQVLEFIYDNIEECKMIFFCSSGTSYENIINKMIEVEEESSIIELKKENFKLDKINRFFVHVMSTSGINNMLEAVSHDLSKDEAYEYMEKIQRFYYAGTKEILGA